MLESRTHWEELGGCAEGDYEVLTARRRGLGEGRKSGVLELVGAIGGHQTLAHCP